MRASHHSGNRRKYGNREGVTIHRGMDKGESDTEVGSHCLLMAYVHVGHDCIVGDYVIMAKCIPSYHEVAITLTSWLRRCAAICKIGAYTHCGYELSDERCASLYDRFRKPRLCLRYEH